MIHLDRLKASGLTPDKLKPLFTADPPNENIKALIDQIRNRIRRGIEQNIRDYRIYWAIDRAFDAPFYQVAYTQLMGLIDQNKPDDKKVLSQIKDWGLTHLLPDKLDPATGKPCCDPVTHQTLKAVNIPVFYNIYVPLVCAYMVVRWGKLFNDRNLVPLYKYEPAKFTRANRLRCEIITELISRMSNLYDYKADERQAILQQLLYGICIKFPREAWHQCWQEDSTGKKVLDKEGVRFNMPHPARMYWDMFHRANTLNSDTGCRFAGYWEIQSYKEVRSNPLYWNTDKISFGVNSWFSNAPDFFSTVYPCVLSLGGGTSTTQGAGSLDRENAASFYTNEYDDTGTIITQHYERLIPKDYGLSTYEYPVWFRIVMANDGAVLWCEPLATGILPTYQYDADQNRARNRSLAFEVLPFQDLVGQILSQWNLSVRQNLINPIFYDESMVPAEAIVELRNLGEKMLRTKPFIPFNSTENVRFGQAQRDAFFAPQITHHNTAELAQLMKGVLDILDRVLVLSSQEIGQSAPHEQTAEEVRTIAHTTSTRLDFTGTFVDDGIFATKRVLYDCMIAYGHKEVTAAVTNSYGTAEEFKKLIDELDLKLMDESGADAVEGKLNVKGDKTSLELVDFASSRDAANRIDNPGVAAAMAQIFQAVANNPVLIQVLGAPQLVEMLNQVIAVSGLPKEFKLKPMNPAPASPEGQKQQQDQMQEQLIGLTKQIKQAIDQSAQQTLQQAAKIVEPVAQAVKQGQEVDKQIVQGVQQLGAKSQQQEQELAAVMAALQKLSQVVAAAAQRPAMAGGVQPMSPQDMAAQQLVPPEDAMAAQPMGPPPGPPGGPQFGPQ